MCYTQNRFNALLSTCVMSLIATAGWSQSLTWLGVLPDGRYSYAYDVSADGAVVVGGSYDNEGRPRAFRWTAAEGMQDLGTLGGDGSVAKGVSADGSVVVGWAENAAEQRRAFRWTASRGMEDLNTTYASLLTNGSTLIEAYAISPDGRYIVGRGYNAATGRFEAFLLDTCPGGDADKDCICDDWERAGGIDINRDGIIDVQLPNAQVGLAGTEADLEGMTFRDWLDLARIGLPSGDASFDGCVDDADLLAVLHAFGKTGDLPEDVNDDGVVDDADLLQVLFNFGSGC
jgi:probable HAF family extracellular repeat protein